MHGDGQKAIWKICKFSFNACQIVSIEKNLTGLLMSKSSDSSDAVFTWSLKAVKNWKYEKYIRDLLSSQDRRLVDINSTFPSKGMYYFSIFINLNLYQWQC